MEFVRPASQPRRRTFEDATSAAGFSAGDRPTSAAWADLDGDGDLDLYVCHYLVFDLENPVTCQNSTGEGNHYCSPRDFKAQPDHVFRNDGGRFVDVTADSGFVDPGGRGLGVIAADLNDDDRIDIYVANDMSANYLFRNLGDFRFEETALSAAEPPTRAARSSRVWSWPAATSIQTARPTWSSPTFTANRLRSSGISVAGYLDDTTTIGLAAATRCLLGFGISFLDANNDGWPDLISANGHVNDRRPAFPWRMPVQLLVGGSDSRLHAPAAASAGPFESVHLGAGWSLETSTTTAVPTQSSRARTSHLPTSTT